MSNKNLKYIHEYEEHCKKIAKSTTVNIHESVKEQSARIKRLEKNYEDWFEYYLPHYAKSKCASFHRKFTKSIINNSISYTLLELFRGAAKSVHINIGCPLFLMFVKKELNFMVLIGENQDKAKILLSDIQAEFLTNERLKRDYGNQFKHGDWSDGSFTTRSGTKFICLGLGQSPRGLRNGSERPDYITCDDLDTTKRCNNPRLIKEGLKWIMEDLWGCFDLGNGKARFVFANNRIHKNSLLANMAEEWISINKQAKEDGRKLQHFHIKVNLSDNEGNPSWPERHTKEDVQSIANSRPYRSSQREYYNNPIQDGSVFKGEDIQWKKMLPLHKYDALVLYGDLSYKDTGDYKALKLWGMIGKELHHIHCFVNRTSKRNCAEWLYDLYEEKKLNKYNIRYLMEGLFAMDEFINEFDNVGDERGYYVPVVADKSTKANKFDRIESICGYWERGNVWYNEKEKDSTHQKTAIDQLLAFEKGSNAPDDAPDADHGAISNLMRMNHIQRFEPRLGKRKHKRDF